MRERSINRFNNLYKNMMMYRIILVMFFFLLITLSLCSCQKKPSVTIYTGPSDNDIGEQLIHEERYQDALDYYNKMLDETIKNYGENSSAAADINNSIGEIYIYKRNRVEALDYLNKSIFINKKLKDELGLASNYVQMSKISIYISGEADEGLTYLEEAEKIYIKYSWENRLVMAGVLSNKGRLYKNDGEYEKALDCYEKALDIYHKNDQDDAMIYILMGQIYMQNKEYQKAELHFNKANDIILSENDDYLMGKLKLVMGLMYDNKGEYVKAIEEYEKALKVFESDEQYKLDRALIYNNIGYVYMEDRELEKAIDNLIMACQIVEDIYPTTNEVEEDKRDYKQNLRMCYQGITGDKGEESFEIWYQGKTSEVIDSEDNHILQ